MEASNPGGATPPEPTQPDPAPGGVPAPDPTTGFFAALRDTRFTNMITPKLVRFMYILSVIAIGIGVIVEIIAAFTHSAGRGILYLIFAPIVGLLVVILARLYWELVIVVFKIHDAAEQIAANTSHRGTAAAAPAPAPETPGGES